MSDMTPYHQIAELVQWLREDASRREQGLRLLDAVDADLEAFQAKAAALAPADDGGRLLLETSQQGIRLFREATGLVRTYAESRDEAVAEKALSRAREGVEAILRVKTETDDLLGT